MKNYTDPTQPQTVARYFGIRRAGKSNLSWNVEILERDYANMTQDDTDFSKDSNGFSCSINAQNIADTFPIVDPETLEPTEQTITIGELFNLVQSFYIAEAHKRDDANNAGTTNNE